MKSKKVILIGLFFIVQFGIKAQTEDTTKKEINKEFLAQKIDTNNLHSPKKAAKLAALVPFAGLGQMYNKKYWKLPLVYGGAAFFAYQVISKNNFYRSYRDELYLRDISASHPEISFSTNNKDYENFSTDVIRVRKNIYREKRDKMILYSGLFYGLTVLDAVVDAHLKGFNTNKKHLVSVSPTVLPTYSSAVYGINFRLSF
jgi:hypothetical protein